MQDSIVMLICFLLSIGLTALAIYSKFRFMPTLLAGAMWFAMAFLVFEINFILGVCCVGIGFYHLIRSILP